jgi:hypothetical protein
MREIWQITALNNALYQRQNQHPANYTRRGCKVYQEIIRTRFFSPRITANIHITNALGQDIKSPAHHRKLKDNRK